MAANKIFASHLRGEYLKMIEEHEFLPDHVKPLAKTLVTEHFSLLSQSIGALELTYHRTRFVEKEGDQ